MDPLRSQANRDKYGIDFVQAQELWLDPDLLELPAEVQLYEQF